MKTLTTPSGGTFTSPAENPKEHRLNKAKHVENEWDEGRPDGGGDGYWITLKTGWKWSGDYLGAVHAIHEDTRAKAWRETVIPCDCKDCQPKGKTMNTADQTTTKAAGFTKGPWKIGAGDNEDGCGILGDESEQDASGRTVSTHIAIVHGEGNASLIMAAPELLAALELITESFASHFPHGIEISTARAAIRKAKGE